MFIYGCKEKGTLDIKSVKKNMDSKFNNENHPIFVTTIQYITRNNDLEETIKDKSEKTAGIGANAFHDVISQAMKNSRYLINNELGLLEKEMRDKLEKQLRKEIGEGSGKQSVCVQALVMLLYGAKEYFNHLGIDFKIICAENGSSKDNN